MFILLILYVISVGYLVSFWKFSGVYETARPDCDCPQKILFTGKTALINYSTVGVWIGSVEVEETC